RARASRRGGPGPRGHRVRRGARLREGHARRRVQEGRRGGDSTRRARGERVRHLMRPLVIAESALDLVGSTPPLRITPAGADRPRASIGAKMEPLNPGGSVKDRICVAMIEEAERSGALAPDGVVVEPTSGNTGIGLALACAVKGYRCILTMPASMSLERRQL